MPTSSVKSGTDCCFGNRKKTGIKTGTSFIECNYLRSPDDPIFRNKRVTGLYFITDLAGIMGIREPRGYSSDLDKATGRKESLYPVFIKGGK